MNSMVLSAVLAAALVMAPAPPQELKLEDAFITKSDFEYNGYLIRRTFQRPSGDLLREARVIVMRGKKQLAALDGCCYEDSARYALISLLGTASKQLVVETYSGGGHCCTSYYIYDLKEDLHRLFGGDYSSEDIGYSMELIDIDKDGTKEFVQSVMNFDYFYSPHARSVFPEVVFAYHPRARKYLPANRRFAAYLLRDVAEKKRQIDKLNADQESLSRIIEGRGSEKTSDDLNLRIEYFHSVVDVTLAYVYAGRRDEGWRFFDQNYRLRDKQELKADILDILRTSEIYNFMYRSKSSAH